MMLKIFKVPLVALASVVMLRLSDKAIMKRKILFGMIKEEREHTDHELLCVCVQKRGGISDLLYFKYFASISISIEKPFSLKFTFLKSGFNSASNYAERPPFETFEPDQRSILKSNVPNRIQIGPIPHVFCSARRLKT